LKALLQTAEVLHEFFFSHGSTRMPGLVSVRPCYPWLSSDLVAAIGALAYSCDSWLLKLAQATKLSTFSSMDE
jgi:hypothetical protein